MIDGLRTPHFRCRSLELIWWGWTYATFTGCYRWPHYQLQLGPFELRWYTE